MAPKNGNPMARRPQPKWAEAKTWGSLLDLEKVDIDKIYDGILINLALMCANDEQEKGAQGEAPDVSDPAEVLSMVTSGQKPAWWPSTLDRIEVTVKSRPNDQSPQQFGPSPFDPNSGKDLGRKGFSSLVKIQCESIGTPFFGVVEIEVKRKRDKRVVGGSKFECAVGESMATSTGSGGAMDATIEWYEKRHRNDSDAMMKMFMASSSVITASASAINAMRGVNMAPPWMQDQNKEGGLDWMGFAGHALELLMHSGVMGSGGPQQAMGAAGRMMGQAAAARGPQRMLPMYADGPQQADGRAPQMRMDTGYDDYMKTSDRGPELMEEGEYDGISVDDSDLIDENWSGQVGGREERQAHESRSRGPSRREEREPEPEVGYDGYEEGPDDEGGGGSGGYYEERQEAGGGDPLAGKSPEEVAAYMERWLESEQAQDKGKIKGLGMRLMKKLF